MLSWKNEPSVLSICIDDSTCVLRRGYGPVKENHRPQAFTVELPVEVQMNQYTKGPWIGATNKMLNIRASHISTALSLVRGAGCLWGWRNRSIAVGGK